MRRQQLIHRSGEHLFYLKENRERLTCPLRDQRSKSAFRPEENPHSAENNGPKATLSNAWLTIKRNVALPYTSNTAA
jgi:hypothetical protein